MTKSAPPQEIVRALVRVVNGEMPRSAAEACLHPRVKIHVDSSNYRGITIWYKWIHFIRTCGRLQDLRMMPGEVRCDPQNPELVHLSIRLSGIDRTGRAPVVAPDVSHLRYRVRDGRIEEIWTKKSNYVLIFGGWIRSWIGFPLLLGWATLYFMLLSLRGGDFRADRASNVTRGKTR